MTHGRKTIAAALAALLLLGVFGASAAASSEPAEEAYPAADAASAFDGETGGACGDDTRWELTGDGVLTIDGSGSVTSRPWESLSSSIRHVVVRAGVTALCGYAFYRCPQLETASLPEGLAVIGEYAFHECTALREVTIPVSVRTIGAEAFYGCGALQTARYAGTEAQWRAMDIGRLNGPLWGAAGFSPSVQSGADGALSWTLAEGVLSVAGEGAMDDYDRGAPWYAFKETIRRVEIGEGVTRVGAYAFENCPRLEEVLLPESLTAIGDFAFLNCAELTLVPLPTGQLTLGAGVFSGCAALEEAPLPNGLAVIPAFLFQDCAALRTAAIPAGVTMIGEGAFQNCVCLEEIALPESLAGVGNTAFSGCEALRAVRYGGTQQQWGEIAIGYDNEPLLSARGGEAAAFTDMDGLAALLAAGAAQAEYTGTAPFRIDRDLVIPAAAAVVFRGPVVVAEGVTVENYGTAAFASVTVFGSFRNCGDASADDVTGAENIRCFGDNFFVKNVRAADEASLRAALRTEDSLRACVRLTGDAALSSDLVVPRGAAIELSDGVRLTVPYGTVLTVEGSVRVGGGALAVAGILRNEAYWDCIPSGGLQNGVIVGAGGRIEGAGGLLGGGVYRLVGVSPEDALKTAAGPAAFGLLYQEEGLTLLARRTGSGDADGDGTSDAFDAAAILLYAVGRRAEQTLDQGWGDANGNGRLDPADAALLLSPAGPDPG